MRDGVAIPPKDGFAKRRAGIGGEVHLILGGSGFIGRHVARLLAMQGCRVVIADAKAPDHRSTSRFPAPKFKQVDLANADWGSLLRGVDVVHHYAWSSVPASANDDPARDLQVNMNLTIGLLDALRRRGRGRLVFASSGGSVYGKLRHAPVRETHPLAPLTAYGAGKATAETYLALYRSLHGVDCRIARIANPYGAGQSPHRGLGAVTTFAFNALNGKPIEIWGDGETVRDYVHISDVAAGLVALASVPTLGLEHVFNLGSGMGVSLNQIVAELELQLGTQLQVNRSPARTFDTPVSVLAVGLAQRRLGWRPHMPFAQGVARTLADLRSNRTMCELDPQRMGGSALDLSARLPDRRSTRSIAPQFIAS